MATMVKEVSLSNLMGVAVGVAARRLTTDALYGAGLCLAGLQCLEYLGFISIHWDVVSSAAQCVADQNKDGKVDMEDAMIIFNSAKHLISRSLPDIGGFTTGFLLAYRFLV